MSLRHGQKEKRCFWALQDELTTVGSGLLFWVIFGTRPDGNGLDVFTDNGRQTNAILCLSIDINCA